MHALADEAFTLHGAVGLFFLGTGLGPKALHFFFLGRLRAAVPGKRPSARPVDYRQADIFAHSPPPEDAGNGRV